MPLLQLGTDIPVVLYAAQLIFATPSKVHKATEEKYFGNNQLMLNWFVELLLTLLPLIALLVILTSKDLPDIEQDDSTSSHEKKAKPTSSRVKTNVSS